MRIIQDFIPVGRANRPGRANPMLYITIHNTGNTSKGANAEMHARYVQGEAATNAPLSWHYTVDENGAYQHLPDNEDGFHAGDSVGNRQSIGIEICMNSNGGLLDATNNAAELTASLCKRYEIPIENVVQHNHWSGKNCPEMLRAGKPYNWRTFISQVQVYMGMGDPEAKVEIPKWQTDGLQSLIDNGIVGDANYWEIRMQQPLTVGEFVGLLGKAVKAVM